VNQQINIGDKASTKSVVPLLISGAICMGLGLLAVYAMMPTVKNAIRQFSWVKTSCTIDSSNLLSDEYGTDSIQIAYHYTVNGERFSGTRYELSSSVSHNEVFYKGLLARLEPGIDTECFYDPKEPNEVTLSRTTFGDAAVIFIPGIFVAIGALLIFFGRPRSEQDSMLKHRQAQHSLSKESESSAVGWGRILFFSLFVIAGLGVTYLFFGMSFLALQQAKSWVPARCTIIDCRVSVSTSRDSKSGKTSESHSLDISYKYQIGDKRYIGNEYSPAGSHFLTKERMYELANSLTRDLEVDCFVDPMDATKSAINRDIQNNIYLGLLPLIFSAAGILGFLVTGGSKQSQSPSLSQFEKRSTPRIRNFIIYLITTIIWNGILALVLFGIFSSSKNGIESYVPLIIAIPFFIIGFLMIVGIPYSFLQLFNPKVVLELGSEKPDFGKPFKLSWRLLGNPRRVKELVIELKPEWVHAEDLVLYSDLSDEDFDEELSEDLEIKGGQEQAPVTKHAQSSQASEKLKQIRELIKLQVVVPFSTSNTQMIEKGSTEFMLPALDKIKDLPPGIIAKGWNIVVKLKIPWYPDSNDVHKIDI
jgi:Protein of unknown function (DUF3592)